MKIQSLVLLSGIVLVSCIPADRKKNHNENFETPSSAYEADVAFLKKFGEVIILATADKTSQVCIMPSLQGRVMTSTAGKRGKSFGWINKELFSSGDTSAHMNAFGGEERFWIGPEGGQFSVFFEKGTEFTLADWHAPRLIDLDPFETVSTSQSVAAFTKSASLKNYSNFTFNLRIDRQIRILEKEKAFDILGVSVDSSEVVAYESTNKITNASKAPWSRKTGLLSIWMLGMFPPSSSTTVIIPFNNTTMQAAVVIDDYFGKVPLDRLKINGDNIYFKGDGEYRSKIGLTPHRAKDVLASYDEESGTLTIVKYLKPDGITDYVNSKWEIQKEPFSGDAINSYNDGPPVPGAKPLGPFYELETSSPAYELKPGEAVTHVQTTFHIQASEKQIDLITRNVLGAALEEIKKAF